ncbi:unannotated protein [freshwater metagenome]|uniref:Unannotated protein n=1 Tax=freshwater metagenome TaxID=449393 RepID=A0A6J6BPV6_9ZZZZ
MKSNVAKRDIERDTNKKKIQNDVKHLRIVESSLHVVFIPVDYLRAEIKIGRMSFANAS